MFEIGRVCVKTAGRDAGLKCVIIDVLDKNTVLIDGQTRRRKCSISHLEPLATIIEVGKSAENSEVVAALKKAGIEAGEKKKPEVEKPAEKPAEKVKPKKARKVRAKEPEKKVAKKPAKKAAKKTSK